MRELQIQDLSKTYGDKTLFNHLSFLIHEKDRIGLIGINGTGKTTLLSILAGKDSGETGQFVLPQDYRIGYLSQSKAFDPKLSVADTIFEGDSPIVKTVKLYEDALARLEKDGLNEKNQKAYEEAERKMNQEDAWLADTNAKIILQKLGISNIQQPMGSLSGGQQKRVALAQILIQEPNLLLLDEPTNHLDFATIQWLETYLSQYKGALVVVTHDRYFLDEVATRIFELSHGNLYEYKGNYEQYILAKSEREEQNLQQERKRQQLYKQELAWMRAGVKARGTKQQARIDRFQDLKATLNQLPNSQGIEIDVESTRLGKKVLELKDASYSIGELTIVKDFDLLIQARERLGITGKNGAGKSTLLNILAGRLPLTSGTYTIGETVNLAYYTQQNEDIDPNKRVIQYLQEVAEEVEDKSGNKISITEMLERFLFPRNMHGSLVGKLSGGEKRRLYLLKLLIERPNVLLLDEPTNDLDIDTLTILEDFIQQFQGAVISVSHDRYFLDKTAEKLIVFEGDGKINRYHGAMTAYLEETKKAAIEHHEGNQGQLEKKKQETIEFKKKKKLSYMEQKEWETIEDDIELLEEKLVSLKNEMNQIVDDFNLLQQLQQQVEEVELALEEKMERWEYLSQYSS